MTRATPAGPKPPYSSSSRLERAGLVERNPDPADRRAILVRLTPVGQERAIRALQAVLAADRRFLAPLDAADRGLVAAALKQLLLRAEPGYG